jgi:hypothetical protein
MFLQLHSMTTTAFRDTLTKHCTTTGLTMHDSLPEMQENILLSLVNAIQYIFLKST